MAPDRGLLDKKQLGVKRKKTRLTYAFTLNADGSEKLPAFTTSKAARPRVFNKKTGGQLKFYYQNNAKVWMTAHLL
jgi:DDE superfamily endonuclease